MGKPPAFQMYAADFLVDTMDWTPSQVGAYLRLLLYEWVNGPLPSGMSNLARIAGVSDTRTMYKMWSLTLVKKFVAVDGNLLINPRLEEERKKQEEWREKSRLGGIKSGEKRRRVVEPSLEAKRNSSVFNLQSSNNPKNKDKSLFSLDSREMILSQYLFDKILNNNPKVKKPNLQTWAKQIDLMIRIDKRLPDDIQVVIDWCQDDDFWKLNILSTKKLREKFDQLYVKMTGGNKRGQMSNATRRTLRNLEEIELT